jgi:hypothetical protein
MNLLKSVRSGFAALSIAAVAVETPQFLSMMKYRTKFSEPLGDGYFVVVHWHIWRILCISVLAFSAGFLWQHRRTR